jgi:hypothetical protein
MGHMRVHNQLEQDPVRDLRVYLVRVRVSSTVWHRAGAKVVRQRLLPTDGSEGQSSAQAGVLPICSLRDSASRAEQGFLPTQAIRGEGTQPSGHRLGAPTGECVMGDATRRAPLPGAGSQGCVKGT